MRESKYSIFAHKVRMDIRKEEEKLGRKFTKEESRKFTQKDIKRLRRKAAIVGILASMGIGGAVTTTKLLDAPKGNNNIKIEQMENNSETEQFKKRIQYEVVPNVAIRQNKEGISRKIAEKYNSEYNKNLTQEDIGYIESKPQSFGIDKKDNYVFDYKGNVDTKDYKDNDYNWDTLYVIINRKNNEIISAIGEIDDEIVNVQAKQIRTEDKEYLESKETIDITIDENGNKKDKKELKEMYNEIKDLYEQRDNDNRGR